MSLFFSINNKFYFHTYFLQYYLLICLSTQSTISFMDINARTNMAIIAISNIQIPLSSLIFLGLLNFSIEKIKTVLKENRLKLKLY